MALRPELRPRRVRRIAGPRFHWKYVKVRRLLAYIERSIESGTHWVVSEPNDETTWSRVRRDVDAFLERVWRTGRLVGHRPQHAWFVRCDRTTMSQADIDSGRLVILVGVAVLRPAEFVLIRIQQMTKRDEDPDA